MEKQQRIDWILFGLVVGLSLFGVMMVYSASAVLSMDETKGATQFSYVGKQALFAVVGLVLMLVFSRIDYRAYNNPTLLVGGGIVLLVGMMVVFAFPAILGAHRWIRFGGFTFQPAEFTKIFIAATLAYIICRKNGDITDMRSTIIPCLGLLGVTFVLLLAQKDLGTGLVLMAIFASTAFAAGARIWHFALLLVVLFLGSAFAMIIAPHRIRRLIAFFDPCAPESAQEAGYQVCQSLYAVGSGGIFGEGFARSQQKLSFLPFAHSDFIFSIVAEELGFIGAMAVIAVFCLILWRGVKASFAAPDSFGVFLGTGLITGLVVQALFNISVTLSILPAKGIPLPFISYGGSSIIASMISIGVLLNISGHSTRSEYARDRKPIARRRPSRSKRS